MMFSLAKTASSCDPLRYQVAKLLVSAQLAIDRRRVAHVDANDCVQLLFEYTISVIGAELAPGLIAQC